MGGSAKYRNSSLSFYKLMQGGYLLSPETSGKGAADEGLDEQRNNLLSVLTNKTLDRMVNPTPTERAQMNPLPQTGREVLPYWNRISAIDDLNDGDKILPWDRNASANTDLYNRLIDGRIDTENGGFVFLDGRLKNQNYLSAPNMPTYEDVIRQIKPQITPRNLREVINGNEIANIDGVPENGKLFVFETNVIKTTGGRVKTYVKFYAFHSNEGKPYMILVSLHRPQGGRIANRATQAERG